MAAFGFGCAVSMLGMQVLRNVYRLIALDDDAEERSISFVLMALNIAAFLYVWTH